jgi:dCTP deaminase
MPIMPDHWIRRMATEHGMIAPFVEGQRRDGVISYGLSSFGYDARAADEFKVFTNVDNDVVDPKRFSETGFVTRRGPVCVIPPNSFVLTSTIEVFRIPRDILVICLGKSTYAPLRPDRERDAAGARNGKGR